MRNNIRGCWFDDVTAAGVSFKDSSLRSRPCCDVFLLLNLGSFTLRVGFFDLPRFFEISVLAQPVECLSGERLRATGLEPTNGSEGCSRVEPAFVAAVCSLLIARCSVLGLLRCCDALFPVSWLFDDKRIVVGVTSAILAVLELILPVRELLNNDVLYTTVTSEDTSL